MTPDILARYGARAVPRYTSYPTAPSFSADVDEGDYRDWLGAVAARTELSLYLHVPFCRAMCWYCGCNTTVSARAAPVTRYLDSLHHEVDLVTAALSARMPLRHLHFGGGTPTLMRGDEMIALMAHLRERFDFLPDAELAIEIDPRTLTAEMVDALAQSGINRASLGVQSFDPLVQQAINRVQSFATTASSVNDLRAAGIDSISLDLIYGLPHQSVASCRDTVEQALRLTPDRLSVFGYAHVPHFKLHQRKIDTAALPDTGERLAQSQAIADALTGAGYIQIGLDHFARPDDAMAQAAAAGTLHRNFQGYTTDSAPVLIGLGSSAIGRLPGGYVQNAVRISDYQKAIAEGRLPVARGYAMSDDDRLRGAIIERLMCDHRVDIATSCAAFDADPGRLLATLDLDPLVDDGLIERDGTAIAVRDEARPLVRFVAAAFDAYLADSGARHVAAV